MLKKFDEKVGNKKRIKVINISYILYIIIYNFSSVFSFFVIIMLQFTLDTLEVHQQVALFYKLSLVTSISYNRIH